MISRLILNSRKINTNAVVSSNVAVSSLFKNNIIYINKRSFCSGDQQNKNSSEVDKLLEITKEISKEYGENEKTPVVVEDKTRTSEDTYGDEDYEYSDDDLYEEEDDDDDYDYTEEEGEIDPRELELGEIERELDAKEVEEVEGVEGEEGVIEGVEGEEGDGLVEGLNLKLEELTEKQIAQMRYKEKYEAHKKKAIEYAKAREVRNLNFDWVEKYNEETPTEELTETPSKEPSETSPETSLEASPETSSPETSSPETPSKEPSGTPKRKPQVWGASYVLEDDDDDIIEADAFAFTPIPTDIPILPTSKRAPLFVEDLIITYQDPFKNPSTTNANYFPYFRFTEPRGYTVETFLKKIGRGCDQHIELFEKWEDLMETTPRKLKDAQVPVRNRKWILHWVEQFKQGRDPVLISKSKSKAKVNKKK